MAVPKKRRSYTRKGKRRSHLALKTQCLSVCGECDRPMLPHRVCEKGFDCAQWTQRASSRD